MARLVPILLLLISTVPAWAWDLTRPTIPVEEIRSGGPPRDGIPALFEPPFVAADEAGFLAPDDLVLGFVHGSDSRAYPLRILSWHELVNDHVGGTAVLVSW